MVFIHISVYLRASVVYNSVEDFYRVKTGDLKKTSYHPDSDVIHRRYKNQNKIYSVG
jgi:hypothetical protein